MHGCMEITGNDLCQAANVKKHAIKELQQVQWLDQYKRWLQVSMEVLAVSNKQFLAGTIKVLSPG